MTHQWKAPSGNVWEVNQSLNALQACELCIDLKEAEYVPWSPESIIHFYGDFSSKVISLPPDNVNPKPEPISFEEAGKKLDTVYFEWPEHIKGPPQVSRSAYNSRGGLVWKYEEWRAIADCALSGGKLYAQDPTGGGSDDL